MYSDQTIDSVLEKICSRFHIGSLKGTTEPVLGGLLHDLWRIETDRGSFAVKVLNPEIMVRPDAKRNFHIAEQIANEAHHNGIHAVVAKRVADDPWVVVEGQYVMLFDWVAGLTLSPEQCTPEYTMKIGKLLYQLHDLEITIPDMAPPAPPKLSTVSEETWTFHLQRAEESISCWGFSYTSLLSDVLHWSRLSEHAAKELAEPLVISHRDVDTKNVIWTSNNVPVLIDWESAGYVHPSIELIQAALDWSRKQDGTSDKNNFQTLIQGYFEAGGRLYGSGSTALYGTLKGTLEWLEYNMRRSTDTDTFHRQERALGQMEAKQTIHYLQLLNERIDEYAKWIEELSR